VCAHTRQHRLHLIEQNYSARTFPARKHSFPVLLELLAELYRGVRLPESLKHCLPVPVRTVIEKLDATVVLQEHQHGGGHGAHASELVARVE
jgi:hypothetical protein